MAEPIVRSFVIDTSESEQNLKELNVQINATDAAINQGAQAFDNVAVAQDEVVASSKSLKAQLRELQAQIANTEPDSAKYRELAAAAGELKDRIGDAAEAVGTQAGGAFERVSGSLGLVTGRIANLDFEGAAEGAKLLAQNITQIKPGDITKGIQGIGSALGSVGKALLTNPIFLIGAAIAAAVVYAEELLSLIDGVTDAETEALDVQKERAALAKEQFDAIGAQEESLKRQGLSEKEITQLKLQALNTAILEQQAVVETTRIQAEGQIKAAERNAKYLQTFLDFVTFPQRKLAEFFEGFVNGSIDILNKLGLGIEKIDVTGVFDDINNFIVKQVFDPEAERKNQEKIVKDAEKNLIALNNQRDGILNAQDAKEKATRDKANADRLTEEQKTNAAILESRKKLAEQSAAITKQIREDAAKPVESTKTELTDFDAELKAQQDAEDLRISLMAEGQDKEIAIVDSKYAKLRAAAQGDAELMKQIALQNQAEVDAINENAAQKEIALNEAVQDAKLASVSQALGAINGLVSAFAKGDEKRAKRAFQIQKAVSIAQATVDTYKGANAIFASAAANPATVLFPAQPFIAAAAAIAGGIANVATIAQQQFQGGGTPGGTNSENPPSLPGDGGGGGAQPAQFNPLAASFLQDRPEQLTPRAYVLAGDVASAQEVRENVADLARIG